MIQEEIYKLIYSRQSATVLRNIYFEAALKFALESGAALEPGQSMMNTGSIHFEMNIDGTNYFIYLARHADGSTYLGIDDADKMQREFKNRINF
jgi:hypothetical protein